MWFSASLYELGNLGEESVMAKNKAENYLDNLLNSVNYKFVIPVYDNMQLIKI